MPEGTGFSSREGLTRAQPGPGCDVARPVDVGVHRAVGRADHGVRRGPDASAPAVVAADAGAGGFTNTVRRPALSALAARMLANCAQPASRIDLLSPAFAAAMFGRNTRPGPGLARRGAACHGGYLELFQCDRVAGLHEHPRGLVVEVAPPVADLAPFFRERPPQPPAVPRTPARALLAPLQVCDRLSRSGEELGVGDDLPIRGGQEPGHPQINTHAAAQQAPAARSQTSDCHDHIPAAMLSLELEGFHGSGDGPCWRTLTEPTP